MYTFVTKFEPHPRIHPVSNLNQFLNIPSNCKRTNEIPKGERTERKTIQNMLGVSSADLEETIHRTVSPLIGRLSTQCTLPPCFSVYFRPLSSRSRRLPIESLSRRAAHEGGGGRRRLDVLHVQGTSASSYEMSGLNRW